jgi:hypothetical protein
VQKGVARIRKEVERVLRGRCHVGELVLTRALWRDGAYRLACCTVSASALEASILMYITILQHTAAPRCSGRAPPEARRAGTAG